MRTRLLMVATLAILFVIGSPPAGAQPSEGVADSAIIATNSIDLDRNVQVTGNVVVNLPSDGPTLDGGVDLNVDKVNTFGIRSASGDLVADSIALNKFATITGSVFYNELFDQGATIGGTQVTPLGLPYFAQLPAFQAAMINPGAPDVFVGSGDPPATLAAGMHGDIEVGAGATLTITGGTYNVRSLTVGQAASLLFEGGADIRIEGRLQIGKNSIVDEAPGADVDGSQIVMYVGGINGVGGGLLEPPLAADIGKDAFFLGNVYAPAGTIRIGSSTATEGSFLARDVWVGTGASVILASFVNKPPTADPKSVLTSGQPSVDIVLSGSDPEGGPLSFSIATLPGTGALTDSDGDPVVLGVTLPTPTVTFTPTDQFADAEDSFDYTVTDNGGLSDTATVSINPTETCVDDSDCDPGFFCDTSQPAPICVPTPVAVLIAQDNSYETAVNTPIQNLVLSAQAPDTVGGLEFQIIAQPPATEGSVSTPPTAQSPRSATVTFTPATDFEGDTSFDFQACEKPALTNCDQATISISVQALSTVAPPVALDQTVTAPVGGSVTINLVSPENTSVDPEGRECTSSSQCADGFICEDGSCVPGP